VQRTRIIRSKNGPIAIWAHRLFPEKEPETPTPRTERPVPGRGRTGPCYHPCIPNVSFIKNVSRLFHVRRCEVGSALPGLMGAVPHRVAMSLFVRANGAQTPAGPIRLDCKRFELSNGPRSAIDAGLA